MTKGRGVQRDRAEGEGVFENAVHQAKSNQY